MSVHRGVLRERMASLLKALALACGLMFTAALCFAAQVKPWGDTATPALKFDALEGGRFDASGLNGKSTVLNFWAVWCELCREELPALARLATSLQRTGFLKRSENGRFSLGSELSRLGQLARAADAAREPHDGQRRASGDDG